MLDGIHHKFLGIDTKLDLTEESQCMETQRHAKACTQ